MRWCCEHAWSLGRTWRHGGAPRVMRRAEGTPSAQHKRALSLMIAALREPPLSLAQLARLVSLPLHLLERRTQLVAHL
jgi:hypothetical protein